MLITFLYYVYVLVLFMQYCVTILVTFLSYHTHIYQFTIQQATKARKGSRSTTLSLTSALDVGVWSTPRPGRFTPREKRYPLYRGLGGPQGKSIRVLEISPPPGFEPRTVQPVASRYPCPYVCVCVCVCVYIYIYIYIYIIHAILKYRTISMIGPSSPLVSPFVRGSRVCVIPSA